MPKGKNHSSKRTTLHQKYKIQKKVKEHHRKARKAEKDRIKKQGGKIAYLRKKDPGVPNAWPFKEEVLREAEEHKEKLAKAKAEEILQRKRLREKQRKQLQAGRAIGSSSGNSLAALRNSAMARQNDFELQEENMRAARKTGDVENTRRAYYRELHKIMENADVILEVLDARDPLGCRPIEVEKYIQQKDPSKRIVLVLNKIDLVPKENVTAWLKYLRRELPTIAIKCSTQSQKLNIGRSKTAGSAASKDQLTGSSECIGGEQLLQLLKNYSRNSKIKMAVTVGVIGYPNVGKSSLINSLVRTRAVETGAHAGVTKVAQEVQLDKKVRLLDCPGIVFAKDETDTATVLRNCVRIDAVVDPIPPVEEILRRCDKMRLMTIYKIARYTAVPDFLQLVAQTRGKVKKGGVLDTEAAARGVLQDWNAGKIPYCTNPPAVQASSFDESSVVAAWGQEFNLDSVQQVEVIDQASVALDEAFMAMESLSLGVATQSDMRFAEPEEDEMEEELDLSAAGKAPTRRADAVPEDALNPRVTKAAKAKRAEATAAAVRRQAEGGDGSDYDFDEAFEGEGEDGAYGALKEEGDEDEDEDDEDEMDDEDEDEDDEEEGDDMED